MDHPQHARLIQTKLAELQQCTYLPPRLVSLICATSQTQLGFFEKMTFSRLKSAISPPQHAQGRPWLSLADFSWNKKQSEQLFAALLQSVKKPEAAGDPIFEAVSVLQKEIHSKKLTIQDALQAYIHNNESFFAERAKTTPTAPSLLRFLCNSTLTPFVERQASAITEKNKAEGPWLHGHCPVCGSLPFIGSLDGKEGARQHTCSFCHHTYRVPRLQCPFCLKEKSDGTPLYQVENDPTFSMQPCESCKNYIKIADFRQFSRPFVPILDDLVSLPLDIKAAEMGYTRPTKSAWGI